MDRFEAMQAFTRVVELNSFTKAALSLNLPKTTLSAQVHALETRLKVKLLHRTTRHVSVTADGAAYYERALRVLEELEETEAAIHLLNTRPQGRLRIDIPGYFGRRAIIPALGEFLRRYPDIELEVGCQDRKVDLVQEGVDCVIRCGALVDESLVARSLGSVRQITCATPAYLKQHGTPTVPADVECHDIVQYVSPRSGKAFCFEYIEEGETISVFGKRRIAFNDLDACVAAALSGMGLIQLPEFMVRDNIIAGKLQPVLEDAPAKVLPFCALYHQNRHLSTKVRAFVEWATELCAQSDVFLPHTANVGDTKPIHITTRAHSAPRMPSFIAAKKHRFSREGFSVVSPYAPVNAV